MKAFKTLYNNITQSPPLRSEFKLEVSDDFVRVTCSEQRGDSTSVTLIPRVNIMSTRVSFGFYAGWVYYTDCNGNELVLISTSIPFNLTLDERENESSESYSKRFQEETDQHTKELEEIIARIFI